MKIRVVRSHLVRSRDAADTVTANANANATATDAADAAGAAQAKAQGVVAQVSPQLFEFSPLDQVGTGFQRVQCAWFYKTKLDADRMRIALALVLPRYPHFAGRIIAWKPRKHTSSDPSYAAAIAASHPTYRPKFGYAINDAGIPFDEAVIHGMSTGDLSWERTRVSDSFEVARAVLIPKAGDAVSTLRLLLLGPPCIATFWGLEKPVANPGSSYFPSQSTSRP
ncbi:hypothetical protein CAOG_03014 [Capsaspora owczarzaki ATCC 30864]|uniref:hypothetical protein n=1 Tax=Capsaspora owczarzaki (strain ATCC 30864) TaxID=595528 RepID=UPI0001FE4538|nr:hypothetical protein CAOG_03014 [Capsaspora owczarzaki ATCC 30864]|eukprot:XP_004363853.1 hypothetical protein CAOG_03014 [Capsaspora owczarzaki ATCC 30864]